MRSCLHGQAEVYTNVIPSYFSFTTFMPQREHLHSRKHLLMVGGHLEDLEEAEALPVFSNEFLDFHAVRERELREVRLCNRRFQNQNLKLAKQIDDFNSKASKLDQEWETVKVQGHPGKKNRFMHFCFHSLSPCSYPARK
eukprot:m.188421 g.188421  ORF g.188421 m.188421 type:complete len:140 (-) comp25641_c0_seq10:386-805(-)